MCLKCLILVITDKIQSFLILSKKVIGKMKYEFGGRMISEFIGLRWNMYSLVDVDGEESKKSKKS